jgi:plastocyanin
MSKHEMLTRRALLDRRRTIMALGATLCGIALALGGLPHGSLAGTAQAMTAQEIKIDDFKFVPGTLTIPVGTTVTWINDDGEPHTVTSADEPRRFKSTALDTGDRFSFTFTDAGTYSYFCSVHPHMIGKIVVQ